MPVKKLEHIRLKKFKRLNKRLRTSGVGKIKRPTKIYLCIVFVVIVAKADIG